MTRKKISQRTRRKDDLDPTKDQFVSRSISVLDWAVERRRQIGVILGVGLLAAVAAIIFSRIIESERAAASALLGNALVAYFAPLVPPQENEPIPDKEADEETLTFETSGARATESLKHFEETIGDQGSSTIGLMATLGAAGAYLELGEVDKAIASYEQFLVASGAPWLKPNALDGLGHALEIADKLDEARARFKELGEQSEGRTRLFALYNEARIAQRLDDKIAATDLLREIIDKIKEDGEYDRLDFLFIEAGERLKHLDPEADVPALPGGGFGGLDGIDPATLQQLIRAQQQAGGRLQ